MTTTINTGTYTSRIFYYVQLRANNIIGILDITDADGNIWYEVPYLGQEMVYDSIKNTNPNDPNLSSDQTDTPYLLKNKQVAKKICY